MICLLFYVVDICTVDGKAMVGKMAGALPGIKAVETNCSTSHCTVHCHEFVINTVPVSLKNILHEK